MAFSTLPEFKTHLNLTGSTQDTELQTHLDSAERITAYLVGPSTSSVYTEKVRAGRSGRIVLTKARPVTAITSITPYADGVTIDSTDFDIADDSGIIATLSGAMFVGRYTVVFTAGWVTVQANHALACRMIAEHLWRTQNRRPGRGEPTDDVTVVLGFAIPNRALELISDTNTAAQGGIA